MTQAVTEFTLATCSSAQNKEGLQQDSTGQKYLVTSNKTKKTFTLK